MVTPDDIAAAEILQIIEKFQNALKTLNS